MDAEILLLGTEYDACTAMHLAEARVKDPPLTKLGVPWLDSAGKRVWLEYEDLLYDSNIFLWIGHDYEKRAQARDEKRAQAHDEKRAQAHDEKRAQAHDEKRAQAHDEKRAQAHDEKRAQARDEKRAQARDEKRAQAHDEKRAQAHDEKRAQARDEKRAQAHDEKRAQARAADMRIGKVGAATSRLLRMRPLVDHALAWLERRKTLGD